MNHSPETLIFLFETQWRNNIVERTDIPPMEKIQLLATISAKSDTLAWFCDEIFKLKPRDKQTRIDKARHLRRKRECFRLATLIQENANKP